MMNITAVEATPHTITLTLDNDGLDRLNTALRLTSQVLTAAYNSQEDTDERKRLEDAITTLATLYSSIP